MSKSLTSRIVIFEPDVDQLKIALAGRQVSPGLAEFLKNLLKRKKWARKINIPSDHDDAAAVLVFTTQLKEGGLEIFSELHVFCAGRTMVEKWQVVGEGQQISLLPKEAFRAIDISKVRVDGLVVNVEFSVPIVGGQSRTLIKTFDFSVEDPEVRTVPHPLLEVGSFDAEKRESSSAPPS
jgi:hypothetical protein